MSTEFDNYAQEYDALLKDPIRDRFASGAEFFHVRKWLLLRDFLRRTSRRPAELSWLDVGCGKGELLQAGKSEIKSALGCDPSLEMLRATKDIETVHQSEPAKLPFESGSFDVVTAACVYHHLNDGDRISISSELFRVLRPGGVAAIFEHNPWNPATRLIVSRTPVDADAVLLRAGETRGLMRAAGLRVVETAYYLYFPQRVFKLVGGVERILSRIPAGGQYAVFAERVGR